MYMCERTTRIFYGAEYGIVGTEVSTKLTELLNQNTRSL